MWDIKFLPGFKLSFLQKYNNSLTGGSAVIKRVKPVSLVASWERKSADAFKNSHIGGLWGRSCRELWFNISQVRVADRQRRTQLSPILIKNSSVGASAHTGMLVHNGSETKWEMNQVMCSQKYIFFSIHLLCSAILFVCPLFVSLSLLLPSSIFPRGKEAAKAPSTPTSKPESFSAPTLTSFYWDCYSVIPFHFLMWSTELSPLRSRGVLG